jgi:glycosyltransferase involved in cell wall biosynthesis
VEDHLRICFISYKFSPSVGGAEVQAEKQARQLQAFDQDVTIFTLRTDRRLKRTELLDGLPVVRVGGIYKHGGELRTGKLGHVFIIMEMFLSLWRLRHHYEVIHVFQFSPLAAVAALIGKLTHKPVIINHQSAGPGEAQRVHLVHGATLMADTLTDVEFLKIDPSLYWVVGGSDVTRLPQVTVGGHAMLNFLRRSDAFYRILSTRCLSYLASQGFRAEQMILIPNGVDTEKFRPEAELQPDPARSERVIVCVARLEYPKGIDVLLHAWGRMMHAPSAWRTYLKPKLYVVGQGVFRPQMERIIAELGIQDSVELLGLRRDVIKLLQQSWGFVLPSRWEGMPNALLEAMACGLPCVATRVSGSEDIITDGIDGLLVEPEQPIEMAQALRRIVEDSDLAQRLGKEARRTIVRDYQLATVVERCLALYRRLCRNSASGNAEAGHAQTAPLHIGTSERVSHE